MKLVKTANGKTSIRMSRSEWEKMGREAGWMDMFKMPEIDPSLKEKITQIYNCMKSNDRCERNIDPSDQRVIEKLKGYFDEGRDMTGYMSVVREIIDLYSDLIPNQI
jgi:hypothetical protein